MQQAACKVNTWCRLHSPAAGSVPCPWDAGLQGKGWYPCHSPDPGPVACLCRDKALGWVLLAVAPRWLGTPKHCFYQPETTAEGPDRWDRNRWVIKNHHSLCNKHESTKTFLTSSQLNKKLYICSPWPHRLKMVVRESVLSCKMALCLICDQAQWWENASKFFLTFTKLEISAEILEGNLT